MNMAFNDLKSKVSIDSFNSTVTDINSNLNKKANKDEIIESEDYLDSEIIGIPEDDILNRLNVVEETADTVSTNLNLKANKSDVIGFELFLENERVEIEANDIVSKVNKIEQVYVSCEDFSDNDTFELIK